MNNQTPSFINFLQIVWPWAAIWIIGMFPMYYISIRFHKYFHPGHTVDSFEVRDSAIGRTLFWPLWAIKQILYYVLGSVLVILGWLVEKSIITPFIWLHRMAVRNYEKTPEGKHDVVKETIES